ncbi:MAG: hypothetical protein IPP66_22390 [Anaerolineales bacterium]|nr:hypothetical protein [Anaerolineales bacterium]
MYLLASVFLIMNKGEIYDFEFMKNMKDYIGLISLLIVFASYILGLLMHRLIQGFLLSVINTILKKLNIDFNVLGDAKPEYDQMNFVLQQYGSQYLHREIDLQYSAFALFTSLIVSLPTLGIALSMWLSHTVAKDWASTALYICFVLAFLFFVVDIRQRRRFNGIRDAAFKELMKLHEKNLDEKGTKQRRARKGVERG